MTLPDGASHAALSGQVLLYTLMAKLAVGAVLATMLVRFPWFRRILLTEKRDWPERLVFAASLGLPLTAGVIARLLLNYSALDLTLAGAFLAGLLAGPYAGAIVGVMMGLPPTFAGEWGALPFAVGCGFAGGGLREFARRKRSGTSRRSSSPGCTATCGGWSAVSKSTGS